MTTTKSLTAPQQKALDLARAGAVTYDPSIGRFLIAKTQAPEGATPSTRSFDALLEQELIAIGPDVGRMWGIRDVTATTAEDTSAP